MYILAAILFAILTIWAYRQGIKDGRSVSKNEEIKPIIPKMPTKEERQARKEAKERAEQAKTRLDEINGWEPR